MSSIFFTLLAIVSLFIFFQLSKVKASGKQLNRENRINRFGGIKVKNENIIDGEAKEIVEDKKET
ncbi:MAG: hypothetical protein CMD80_03475 [Gammaproteobacteria bacterium]|nr:hypothetical protein [Gammaproteobacteria bacterium]